MVYIRAAEREQQVVASTLRVLARNGVADLTMRAVAAEAEIPLGTLHYVFPSRDRLLGAVVEAVVKELSATLRDGIDLDRGVAHALRHATTNYWDYLLGSDAGVQIMQYELTAYSLRSQTPLARAQYDDYVGTVQDLLERAADASGERCDIGLDELARLSVAMTDGLILQFLAEPNRERALRDLAHVVEALTVLANPRPIGS